MSIYVLIPSYNRPKVVNLTLFTWLRSKYVAKIVVVADADNDELRSRYEEALIKINEKYGNRVIYVVNKGRSGSVNARNMLLKLAEEEGCQYAIMADDDYILPNPKFPLKMAKWLKANKDVGAVGGRVVMINRRAVDPDFFLNTPVPIADPLTRALGYIFLDVRNGPRYAEYLTHFFMIRGELLGRIRYSASYKATAFREESDLHEQIKRLGYRLILDPQIYVYHIGVEYGGDRSESNEGVRMYWKARNHAKFVSRWRRPRIWHLLTAALLLMLYRPWHAGEILRGIRDGLR
ncbi:MAG: glycosyltransferase [Thermofilaceae archaeon]|uniref:glycosyltransferase family 2 protein n=1 Tax=Pyrobaculum sp. TaxID=2004705 RepID=UPI00316EEC3A